MNTESCDYQIFIGLGKSKIKSYFLKRRYIPKITDLCKRNKLGFTVMEAFGGFEGKDSYSAEYSLVILIADIEEQEMRTFTTCVRDTLNQETVLFRKVNAQTEFL